MANDQWPTTNDRRSSKLIVRCELFSYFFYWLPSLAEDGWLGR
jgi:hypothetical protein